MFEKLKKKGFQVLALHHAEAILKQEEEKKGSSPLLALDVSFELK
jgi:hypothetical protein